MHFSSLGGGVDPGAPTFLDHTHSRLCTSVSYFIRQHRKCRRAHEETQTLEFTVVIFIIIKRVKGQVHTVVCLHGVLMGNQGCEQLVPTG